MVCIWRAAARGAALIAGLAMVGPAFVNQAAGQTAASPSISDASAVTAKAAPVNAQVAANVTSQTASLPIGTIRLRVIPRIGGKTLRKAIKWVVMTYGRDGNGNRHQVTEVTGPTPELILPAGWYVVHAHTANKVIKHPVEVTANRIFKYTLVKN